MAQLVLLVPAPRWTPSLTPPARQTAALPGGRLAAVGVDAVAPLQAARPKRARLHTRGTNNRQRGNLSNSLQTLQTGNVSYPEVYRARLVAQRPLPAGGAGAGSICRITFGPVGAAAGRVAARAPGALGAGGGAVRPTPACRHEGPSAMFDCDPVMHWSSVRGQVSRFPLSSVCVFLLPSLQKHVPSIGEQSTAFLQEHPREQFFP